MKYPKACSPSEGSLRSKFEKHQSCGNSTVRLMSSCLTWGHARVEEAKAGHDRKEGTENTQPASPSFLRRDLFLGRWAFSSSLFFVDSVTIQSHGVTGFRIFVGLVSGHFVVRRLDFE